MGVCWTKEQEQVIQLQNRNILVSAAAGSGKTAVLVERIVTMMTRKENPIDIDRLLIVTFTRAAAGEMRERLTMAVEKRLEEDPENEHLQRQQTLIHNAQINTIDGFCAYVIRNYFHTIDLDPGFRIANEGEIKLLKQDVAKELLEENYRRYCDEEILSEEEKEKARRFGNFVEVFASGKADEGLVDLILRLYEFSMSNPWPKEWLYSCLKPYEVEEFKELENCIWMNKLWENVEQMMEQIKKVQEELSKLIYEPEGPYVYEPTVTADEILIQCMDVACRERQFDRCVEALCNHKFVALSRKKGENISEEKRAHAKKLHDRLKTMIQDLKKRYFYGSSEYVLKELQFCKEIAEELVRLTIDFIDAFSQKKKQKNIVDFHDMEHYALEILVKKQDGKLVYTPAADEFAQQFEEILIDEYQDSNLVQETLLQSVSRLRQGKHNIFMVGDVKQSIYRFRLARPELFTEKYETYTLEDSVCQRIDLHKNFRSREHVLSCINYIFEQIMRSDLGELDYDEAAALYPGAVFPQRPGSEKQKKDSFLTTEILYLDQDEMSDEEETERELEARMIGTRILEMVGKEYVLDKQSGKYRPMRYQDCVILLRTISGWAESFVRVLLDMGIPAYTTSKTGYFSTIEVVTVLNYLHILDNPLQDIPFVSILHSPIVGCTSKELASLKIENSEKNMYQCAWEYKEAGKDDCLRNKLQKFFMLYESLRERVPYTPIHELIQLLLQRTGYDKLAAAMPGGDQRRANLEMLVEKAMEYERTSYRGLFNFIRYMEQLQKYEVDFGEVSTLDENENTVRIMSIHKSKGLEFPVVFVAGMGKQFNMSDANTGLIIHPDLGIGMHAINPTLRVKMPTLMRQVMQKQIRLESLGEELRVLYVALTRAKEKLILTGTMKKLQKRVEEVWSLTKQEESRISYALLEGAADYWDWILPALARHVSFSTLYEKIEKKGNSENLYWKPELPFVFREMTLKEMVTEEITRQVTAEERFCDYMDWDTEQIYEEKLREQLNERFSYKYPHEKLQEIPAKISITQWQKQESEEEDIPEEFEEVSSLPVVPQFMQPQKVELQGAARGTAYHRVLELLDFNHVKQVEEIEKQITLMQENGKIDEQIASCVRPKQIHWFANSYLGKRMIQATQREQLWREQPFVLGISANEKNPEWEENEIILMQGIIDAFFEEDGELVLVDYKTDYVKKEEDNLLIEKYQKQVQYYARALTKVRGQKVKEAYLYSFSLGRALPVKIL